MTIPDDLPPLSGGKKLLYTNPDRKPDVLPVDPAGIPAELTAARRWVLWRLEWKTNRDGTGKWDKVPKRIDGRNAKSTDPATWDTFESVWATYQRGGFDGLGFMLGDGFAGIDLDDIRNPVTGEITTPWAVELIATAGTYTDVSPSGFGCKLFGRGVWRGEWHKRPHPSGSGEIEVYSQGRYFTVTGRRQGVGAMIADIQPTLDALASLFEPPPEAEPPPPSGETGGRPLTDEELLERIRHSAQGTKFSRLWAGDAGEYGGDDSRADLALCGLLAFWCRGDADRIDRLFRSSGLMRAKWDGKRKSSTYGRMTVEKAVSGKSEFYDPGAGPTFTPPHSAGVPPLSPPRPAWPDPPAAEAFHGLFGRIVRTLEPHTEADPVALLAQLMVLFGNVVGRGPHFTVESTRHYTNEFVVLVGNTSRARKGTSKDRIAALFAGLDDDWLCERVSGGLSSAEGLIHAIRDPLDDDLGEEDKRLCATEAEWSSVLKQADRTGNTLTELLRNLWDGQEVIGNKTVNPRKVTAAHVSVIAHTTEADLTRYLTGTDAANGYGNRHLFFCVKRSQFLPWGGRTCEADLAPLREELLRTAGIAQHTGVVGIDPTARSLWEAVYPVLEAERGGLAGALTARGSAHVRRLAVLYALADRSVSVRPSHLLAALALWDYAERSVTHLFGDKIGNPLADEIKLLLDNSPTGLTREGIIRLLGKHHYGDRLTKALSELRAAGHARVESVQTGGRPAERWHACRIELGTSPLMTTARDAVQRCDESDESDESPMGSVVDTPFRRFHRFHRTPEPNFGTRPPYSTSAPPERPRVPDVIETWLAHQLWWGPKPKAEIERKAKAAGVGSLTRYVKLLHIRPRELPGGGWEWELPAGLNRDLYPEPPAPPPPPPEPTLFDCETDAPQKSVKPKVKAKKRKTTRRARDA